MPSLSAYEIMITGSSKPLTKLRIRVSKLIHINSSAAICYRWPLFDVSDICLEMLFMPVASCFLFVGLWPSFCIVPFVYRGIDVGLSVPSGDLLKPVAPPRGAGLSYFSGMLFSVSSPLKGPIWSRSSSKSKPLPCVACFCSLDSSKLTLILSIG